MSLWCVVLFSCYVFNVPLLVYAVTMRCFAALSNDVVTLCWRVARLCCSVVCYMSLLRDVVLRCCYDVMLICGFVISAVAVWRFAALLYVVVVLSLFYRFTASLCRCIDLLCCYVVVLLY